MPTQLTLDKYGLSVEEWQTLYTKYGEGVCHVCRKRPTTARLNVEHEHISNYKNLPPEEKKKYIRGMACYICNHRILTRGVTIERLRAAADYLEEYEKRKNGN